MQLTTGGPVRMQPDCRPPCRQAPVSPPVADRFCASPWAPARRPFANFSVAISSVRRRGCCSLRELAIRRGPLATAMSMIATSRMRNRNHCSYTPRLVNQVFNFLCDLG